MASWNEFLKTDRSQWAAEAREHHDALTRRVEGAKRWASIQPELDMALRAHDRAAVARLIAPFQATAETHLLQLLSARKLAQAQVLAVALSQFGNDRYAVD